MSTRNGRRSMLALIIAVVVAIVVIVVVGMLTMPKPATPAKESQPPVASTPPAKTPPTAAPSTKAPPVAIPEVPKTSPSTVPPVAKFIVEHQYRRYVKGTPAVMVKQAQVRHWAWVSGYVDRQQVWMDKNGDDTMNKQDALWMAESATQELVASSAQPDDPNEGWKIGDTRTHVVQAEVKAHYEYLIYGAEGKLHFSTTKADASWIGASLAKKLHAEDNGFEAFAKRAISLD